MGDKIDFCFYQATSEKSKKNVKRVDPKKKPSIVLPQNRQPWERFSIFKKMHFLSISESYK